MEDFWWGRGALLGGMLALIRRIGSLFEGDVVFATTCQCWEGEIHTSSADCLGPLAAAAAYDIFNGAAMSRSVVVIILRSCENVRGGWER